MSDHRKALVINASPHEKSVTSRLCDVFAQSFGVRHTQTLRVYDNPPPYSDGTYNNRKTFWQDKVREADVLMIGTPTYWFNVPAILKAFLDDLAAIDSELQNWQTERFAVIAVHAPEGGEIGAVGTLLSTVNMLGYTVPANGFVYYRSASDRWAWSDLKDVAKRVARA